MGRAAAPEITEMSEEECATLLGSRLVGRIAFSFRDRVDVQPIAFAYRDGWVFGRTSEGSKLTTIRHNRWIAFQVDEIEDLWNWKSVVVRGAMHLLGGEGGPDQKELTGKARAALKEAMPDAFTDADPGSHRSVLFGLAPHEIVGRRSRRVEVDSATDDRGS